MAHPDLTDLSMEAGPDPRPLSPKSCMQGPRREEGNAGGGEGGREGAAAHDQPLKTRASKAKGQGLKEMAQRIPMENLTFYL